LEKQEDQKKKRGPHEGHRERLKEFILRDEVEGLPPHNVLELLLFYVIPRKDTNLIAHDLLDRFKSISGVINAPVEQLREVQGIGDHAATFLHMLPQLFRVYSEDCMREKETSSYEEIVDYIKAKFSGMDKEKVMIFSLDSKFSVIGADVVSEGSMSGAPIDIRSILSAVLKRNARHVIMAHNHPGGFVTPSPDDIEATKNVRNALSVTGIALLDHIIVSTQKTFSMANSKRYGEIFRTVQRL